MNISKLNLPAEFYLSDLLLDDMCKWGVDNFALPEEILSQFDIPFRWFGYYKALAARGDLRAKYVVDRLSDVERKWLAKSRAKVMRSNDTRSISSLLIYHGERNDNMVSLESPLPVEDDWIE